jgi:hypothetical protein
MSKIKENLDPIERQRIIEELANDYEQYVHELSDQELQEIHNENCFTLGSVKYYQQLFEKGK